MAYGIWGEEGIRPDDSILVDEQEATEIAVAGMPRARVVLIRVGRA